MAPSGPPVAFVSTDGSASIGSRSVFVLRNDATGQSTLVPVVGQLEETRTVVNLAPGTYTVTPPPASIGQNTTFTTQDVSAAQITVPDVAASEPVVTVSFSLETQIVPVVMFVDEVTATSAQLNWTSQQDAGVAEYVLVRTDGPLPADSPAAGTQITLGATTATSAVADGLAPNQEYTFALFSFSATGEQLPVRTYTLTTANPGSTDAAYAVAPNTILPSDFAALEAERVGENWVRVRLDPAQLDRGSNSEMSGVDPGATRGAGCVVGTPFLATSAVAGENAFYGVIDVCESSTAGTSRAIVNTDVPLSAVFSYYHLSSGIDPICYDPGTGEVFDPEGPRCVADVVADGSGILPPPEAGTGEVQVTLLWSSGDDLDLLVTDPDDATISWTAPTSASGGTLDLDDRGSDCGVTGNRVENVYWQSAAPRGSYLVEVLNHKGCTTAAEAWIQVRVGGELIIDQLVTVGVDEPIAFDVEGAVSSLWPVNDGGKIADSMFFDNGRLVSPVGNPSSFDMLPFTPSELFVRRVLVAQAGSSAVRIMDQVSELDDMRKKSFKPLPNVSCEGIGDARFGLTPTFAPKFKHDIKLKLTRITWDVEAAIEAGILPRFYFGGEMECSLETQGVSFQLSVNPIPINLELKPDISASASAKLNLEGPKFTVTLGVKSDGHFGVDADTCWTDTWISIPYPCIGIDFKQNTRPIKDFKVGTATATLQGALNISIGAQANIGIGTKNALATAKGGFSFRMFPVAAELKAVTGTSNCIAGALGGRLAVDLLAEAYVVGLGGEYRHNLYDSNVVAYPGAKFEVGKCPDD